jgi:hypothetical protein
MVMGFRCFDIAFAIATGWIELAVSSYRSEAPIRPRERASLADSRVGLFAW